MKTLRTGLRTAVVLALGCWFSLLHAAPAANATYEPGDLRAAGTVDFPVTCAPEVRAEFVRGVTLLHSFFYEEARRIFTAVAEKDPTCAMAQWGISMTWWHPIWTSPTPDEMRAGMAACDKAMAMTAGTDRERRFITALNAYYHTADGPVTAAPGQSCHGPVGPRGRVVAYEQAMHELYDKYPEDFETETFYALAVLAVGYATPTDTSLTDQLRAAGILEKLWRQNPNHPGVAHYLIHAYDYPALAERALPAARAYAAIAPWVPHALHMPSHIYTRLGMWDESIASNLASSEASAAYAAIRHRAALEAEGLHALDYLVYSYLQEAQDGKAAEVLQHINTNKANPPMEFTAAYALASIPARCVLEREDWAAAAKLPVPTLPHWTRFPFLEALIEYTHALGRAHLGDLAGAQKAIERMRQLREASTDIKFSYFRMHLDLQLQAASAWVTFGQGKKPEALALLTSTADAEDKLGKHPVSPGALVPVREQLGEALLEINEPKAALEAYEASLKIYPNRFQGLYGAGLAALRAGDRSTAHRYFAKLAEQTQKADGSRPALVQVHEFLLTDTSLPADRTVAKNR